MSRTALSPEMATTVPSSCAPPSGAFLLCVCSYCLRMSPKDSLDSGAGWDSGRLGSDMKGDCLNYGVGVIRLGYHRGRLLGVALLHSPPTCGREKSAGCPVLTL